MRDQTKHDLRESITKNKKISGADPALVTGGGANSLDEATDPIYFIDFLKNPMKSKKFWSVGPPSPPDPPLNIYLGAARVEFVGFFPKVIMMCGINQLNYSFQK